MRVFGLTELFVMALVLWVFYYPIYKLIQAIIRRLDQRD